MLSVLSHCWSHQPLPSGYVYYFVWNVDKCPVWFYIPFVLFDLLRQMFTCGVWMCVLFKDLHKYTTATQLAKVIANGNIQFWWFRVSYGLGFKDLVNYNLFWTGWIRRWVPIRISGVDVREGGTVLPWWNYTRSILPFFWAVDCAVQNRCCDWLVWLQAWRKRRPIMIC